MPDDKKIAEKAPKPLTEGERPDEADQEFAKAMGRLTGSVPDDAPDSAIEKTDKPSE